MSAITNSDIPTLTTVEEAAVWACELLAYLYPVENIKTGDNTTQLYASRGTGVTPDGVNVFYANIVIPINSDFLAVSGKIWKKTKEIKVVTVPATFKSN